ncbi:MAG: hypothetical protein OEL55_02810, partial [Desulfobulbaceae bacterium]|nr:hypothetical protein [Desulfobulbaceae bacterium]
YLLLSYLANHLEGEYRPVVHSRVDWVPSSLLPTLDLTPADIPVAKLLASSDYAGDNPVILSVND